jgi:hypothetical protein
VPTLQEIVQVNVSVESAPLTPASFGRAAIFGLNQTIAPDDYRLYTSLQGMTDDGFLTTDAEYLAAQALLAQSAISGRQVEDFIVARRLTPVAQVETLSVTAYDAASTYNVTIGGPGFADVTVNVPANTDADTTEADIATAINGSAAGPFVTADASGADLTLTSARAGVPFTVSVSVTGGAGTISSTNTTPNVGLPEDLARVVAAGAEFYCCLTTDRDAGDIEALSAAIESHTPNKIFIAQSSDTAIDDAAYNPASIHTDIASELKGNLRNRTALIYHEAGTEYADAAWAGRMLPFNPGTATWALKQLSGVTATSMTDSEYAIVTGTRTAPTSGKNANVYVPHGSQVSVTQRGMMASGRFIDVQIVADYLQNQVLTSVGNLLLSQPKIPYDSSGIIRVENAVRAPLQAAKESGILASDREINVSVPESANVPSADRTNRVLNNVNASVYYSGAIHHVRIDLKVQL